MNKGSSNQKGNQERNEKRKKMDQESKRMMDH
jgi:hypothetical protein